MTIQPMIPGMFNGVGGNLSGPSAVKDAILAVNADTGQPSYVIDILDTDGSADTYVGDWKITAANTTVRQVANGLGTDAAVTLQGDDTQDPSGLASFMIEAANCTLSGLSPAVKMSVKTAGTSTTTIITGTNGDPANGGGNAVRSNLNYVAVGNEALDHNDYNPPAGGGEAVQVFNNCRFSVGNGPQTFLDTQFNGCQFAGGGFKSVQLDGDVEANNCSYTPESAGGLHLAGAKTATWNDCTFGSETQDWSVGISAMACSPSTARSGPRRMATSPSISRGLAPMWSSPASRMRR